MTLFDAETRGEIVGYNMEKLDLNTISFSFLSHYHGDHHREYKYFLERRASKYMFQKETKF